MTLLSACLSPESPAVGAQASAIVGGTPDVTHTAVVAFLDGPLDGPHHICSATIVAPRVVVTAAHCLTGDSTTRYHVQLGSDVKAPERSIDVDSVVVYPRYVRPGDDQRAGLDLAVATLVEDVGVSPIALPAGDDDGLRAGASVVQVGFGQTDAAVIESAGARFSVSAPVTSTCARLFASGDSAHRFCGGDSGGAVLLRDASGVERLVGVISFGLTPLCAPPGYATRVAPYRAWIASFITGSGDRSCATCPPASFCSDTQIDAGAPRDASTDASGGGGGGGGASGCAMGHGARHGEGRSRVALAAIAAMVLWLISTARRPARGGPARPRAA